MCDQSGQKSIEYYFKDELEVIFRNIIIKSIKIKGYLCFYNTVNKL